MEQILEGLLAIQEKIDVLIARLDARLEGTKDCQRVTEACLERKKPTPEDMANIVARPEDSNRATHEETIRAAEDQSRDQRQAVRCHGQPKKRT
jgi:hypothetical protein